MLGIHAEATRYLRGAVSASKRRLSGNPLNSEDGQAIVELAFALPILLVVVLGIVDFGRAVNYWNDETHVANLGARFAAVGSWPEKCKETATREVPTPTLVAYLKCQAHIDSPELTEGGGAAGIQTPVTVCVSFPTTKDEVGQPVSVTIKSTYKWLPLLKIAASSTITGTATMRLEREAGSSVTSESQCT
jgi:Flp pilus assembly protein TadG